MVLLRKLFFPEGDSGGGQGDAGTAQVVSESGAASAPEWVSGISEDVRETIPAEYLSDPSVTKFKSVPDLLKSHISLQKLVGAKGVIVPGKDATPEEYSKFYNALGRPEKPEGYKFTPVEGVHKNVKVSPEAESQFRAFCHEKGLSNKHADEFNQYAAKWLSAAEQAYEQRQTEAIQKASTALRQEWGEKFDVNKDLVTKGVLKFGGQEAIDAMGGPEGIGNNPHVLKMLGKVFSGMSEDSFNIPPGGPGGTGKGNETREQAEKKINENLLNPESDLYKAFHDNNHPRHREAVEERNRLYDIAYPTGGEE